MAKKRDAIFDEVQIAEINAIVGQQIISIGNQLRYNSTPPLTNANDIPNRQYVDDMVGASLPYNDFSDSDLVGIDGDYRLPYTLDDGVAIVVVRIDYPLIGSGASKFLFPQFDFSNNLILGFTDNQQQNIRVWSTSAPSVPPEPPPAPVFTLQPSTPVSVLQGTTLNLNVTSTDTISYQWYKDGLPLAGETSSTLTVTNFNPSKAGTYYVQAIGAGGITNSNNSIVTNDVGVLINNFTAQDLDGGIYTGITITATDGTDTVNISSGTNSRLRSGVTITISGYSTTKLTAQDGVGTNTNLTDGSQAFNSPINSPLSIYRRVPGTGTCYTIQVGNTELSSGGQDLYITVKRPNNSVTSSPHYAYLSGVDPDPSYSLFITCSEIVPTFKYGPLGPEVTPPSATINTGGVCTIDSECNV